MLSLVKLPEPFAASAAGATHAQTMPAIATALLIVRDALLPEVTRVPYRRCLDRGFIPCDFLHTPGVPTVGTCGERAEDQRPGSHHDPALGAPCLATEDHVARSMQPVRRNELGQFGEKAVAAKREPHPPQQRQERDPTANRRPDRVGGEHVPKHDPERGKWHETHED